MLSRMKTIGLGLLVALSVVLSFELWQGLWSTPTVAPFSGPTGLGQVSTPNLKKVTRPVRVIYQMGSPLKYSVGLPDLHPYDTVLTWLHQADISKQHAVSSFQVGADPAVEVQFGTPLTRTLLLAYVPNAPTLPAGSTVQRLWLAVSPGSDIVFLTVQTNYGITSAATNLSVSGFEDAVKAAVSQQPWQRVGADSYLPAAKLTVERQLWSTSNPQVLPLIRSFFVNPQVITRVSGANQTVIWTDGSRAVQWNQSSGTLEFSDPNATFNNTTSVDLRAIVTYLQSHGGVERQAIVLENVAVSPILQADTYTFRPYIGGLELLGTMGDYTVDWLEGSPVGYLRPTTELSSLISTTPVKTLTASDVQGIIAALVPQSEQHSIDVTLACEAEPRPGGRVLIEPVFEVTRDGQEILRIDAVTGQVQNGGSRP